MGGVGKASGQYQKGGMNVMKGSKGSASSYATKVKNELNRRGFPVHKEEVGFRMVSLGHIIGSLDGREPEAVPARARGAWRAPGVPVWGLGVCGER